ncbi:MAG: cytochrome P450 [Deltaproteobacteria bacterium]|nr:MAG: cytochrome P450 [Deltaproteobacteria bacterium]
MDIDPSESSPATAGSVLLSREDHARTLRRCAPVRNSRARPIDAARSIVRWTVMQPPPGSMGAPFVGEALQFLKDPFAFTLSRTKQHGNVWKTRILGDTVVFFAGPKAFSFFMNPEHFTRQSGSPRFLQELLHPDAVPFLDGERHVRRKRLLLEAFSDRALASYLPNIFAIFARFVDGWADTGEHAIAPALSQLGFDIADTLFAAADPAHSNAQTAADFAALIKGTFAPPINLPFTSYGKAVKARDRLRAYIKHQVATRDGAGSALGVLKAARGPGGEQLSAEELEIEILHFFFAAHGGLTAALAWAIVALGEHPDMARRLRDEADARLGDGLPTLAQIRALRDARAVAREVLRVYPVAPTTFFGVARRDLEIDGYAIRAGWKGAGAIWATLQDISTFTDPTVFRGDRLGDDAVAALPSNAFVPQGGGPPEGHRCPGETLIQLVLPAFLGWFLRNYELGYPAQDASPGSGGLGPLPKS